MLVFESAFSLRGAPMGGRSEKAWLEVRGIIGEILDFRATALRFLRSNNCVTLVCL